MGDNTHIEWADASWNPTTGCSKVSPGCDHCYAETIAHRFAGTPAYPDGFSVTLRPERLSLPLRWTKPRRIFVNSMSDLFHADIPDVYVARVFAVMALAQHHTFQVLTKRHGRMRALLNSPDFQQVVYDEVWYQLTAGAKGHPPLVDDALVWPLPNVWLGVSVESQRWADVRIPVLLGTPAAVRFLSCEPLLGRVDLSRFGTYYGGDPREDESPAIDWVIVGGESGPGARPMHPEWARGLRDQCVDAGIPFHFKQRGEWTWNEPGQFSLPSRPFTDRVAVMHPAGMIAMTKPNPFDPFQVGHPNWTTRIARVGKKIAGRLLDGRTWDEYPQPQGVPHV